MTQTAEDFLKEVIVEVYAIESTPWTRENIVTYVTKRVAGYIIGKPGFIDIVVDNHNMNCKAAEIIQAADKLGVK